MSLDTFAGLKDAVTSWLQGRGDITTELPQWVRLAEAQIERELRSHQMVKRQTATVDSRYTSLPSDHLETIRLHLDGKHSPLEAISADAMADLRASSEDTAGEPRYFAMVGEAFEVYPSPGDTYTGELQYFAQIPKLSDSQTTNWLLTRHPDVYLYGTLMQAGTWLRDPDLMKQAGMMYTPTIEAINAETSRQRYPGPMKMQFKPGRVA